MYSNPQKDRKVGTLEILGKYHPYHAGNTVLSSLGLLYTKNDIYIYVYMSLCIALLYRINGTCTKETSCL